MRALLVDMRLVVDASVLVAELLRARGRRLLAHSDLDLVVAVDAWDETEHELRKRVALLVERGYLEPSPASRLLEESLVASRERVGIVPREVYAPRLAEASRRIPRDAQGVPTIALALALGCGVWTNDRDFFGCGLPVWTTETLIHQLEPDDRSGKT